MLSQQDRIAFSLQIVGSADQIRGLDMAKSQLQAEIEKTMKLDNANKNLFDPVNGLVNSYQSELGTLDGLGRSTFNEQNIQDSANKKIQNYFFPNDMNVTVPSLASTQNIWIRIKPFALTYAIGKNYTEAYGSVTKEPDLISAIQSLISSASGQTNMENTTGQHCVFGTCSNPIYTDESSCELNGGIWNAADAVITFPTVQTLASNIISAVNSLKSFLLSEVTTITLNDPDSANQTQNQAAIDDINNVIIPALNTWLAYPTFNTSHGQTTCSGFNGYNSNLLAPTKLHSTQLAALQSALNTRSSFVSTRISQISTILGNVSQDINTGNLTSSSGLYGKRYGFLLLRLNTLGGTLMSLTGMQTASGAQDSIKANIIDTRNAYYSILPTSIFEAPGNGTAIVHLVDVSFLSPGNLVYIIAEGQEEIVRAVKSINGNAVTLNDVIPAKYRPSEKARLYKDLT